MNDREKAKAIIKEIKADAVSISGVLTMLTHLEKFFVTEDCQKIKCILENKGSNAAWDQLLDVLKCSGFDAFREYLQIIFSSNEFQNTASDLRNKLREACRKRGLEELCSSPITRQDTEPEQSPASQQNRTSRGSRGSFASQSSREWSLDSNDVFQPGQNNIDSDYGAEQKRKYYRSTSKGSKEGKTTHGSAASFGSSKGSMDDNTMINMNDSIKKMPSKMRRKLAESLNQETALDRDWRQVAECLDMGNDVVKRIRDSPDKMSLILEEMEHNAMQVKDLVDILLKIGRKDCVKILEEEGVCDVPPISFAASFQRELSQTESEQMSKACQYTHENVLNDEPKLTGRLPQVMPLQETKKERFKEESSPNCYDSRFFSATKTRKDEQSELKPTGQFSDEKQAFNGENGLEASGRALQESCRIKPHHKNGSSSVPISETQGKIFEDEFVMAEALQDHGLPKQEVERKPSDDKPSSGDAIRNSERKEGVFVDISSHKPSDYKTSRGDATRSSEFFPKKNGDAVFEVSGRKSDDQGTFQETEKDNLYKEEDQRANKVYFGGFQEKNFEKLASIEQDDKSCLKSFDVTSSPQPKSGGSSSSKNDPDQRYESPRVSPSKCMSYTLPFITSVDSKSRLPQHMESIGASSGSIPAHADDRLSKRGPAMSIECRTVSKFQSEGGILPSSPVSPKSDKRWMESDIFRKELGAHDNVTADAITEIDRQGDKNDSRCSFTSQEQLECNSFANDMLSKNLLSSGRISDRKSDTKSGNVDLDDGTNEFEYGQNSDYTRTCNSLPSPLQEQGSIPCSESLCHDSKSSSLKSDGNSSTTSYFHSLLSSFFETIGRGRRPVIPRKTTTDNLHTCTTSLKTIGFGRQVSAVNAIPCENSEKDDVIPEGMQESSMAYKKTEENLSLIDQAANMKPTEESGKDPSSFLEEDRCALLIDNCDYEHVSKLPMKNSTDGLGGELEKCGWQVDFQSSLSKHSLKMAIENFAERSKDKFALVYFFGHSVQIRGENYILPVDIQSRAVKTKANLQKYAIHLDSVISEIAVAKASVVIIDAGRSLPGVTDKKGFAPLKERQNQCVLLTSSKVQDGRFMAALLQKRLQETESITSIRDWIAPFNIDFEICACSRRLLPLPLKVPNEGWNTKILDYANDEVKRLAFFSKANANLETERLHGKWIVNMNTDGNDLESDFNIFLKSVDEENLAWYIFYYEGAVEMDNGELLLKQEGLTDANEPVSLSFVLGHLSETVLGPRIVIINAVEGNVDAKDLDFNQLNLQEVFFMMSPPHEKSSQMFYEEFIRGLDQEHFDIEDALLRLSKNFGFNVAHSSLFQM